MPLARIVDDDNKDICVDGKPLRVLITDGTDDADVATLAALADNLDGLKGLVTAAVLFGREDGDNVSPVHVSTAYNLSCEIRSASTPATVMLPNADDIGTTNAGLVAIARNYGFDGTNFDRLRCRTSDGGDQNNTTVGCQIVINLNYVWDSVNTKWVPMTQP